MEWPAHLPRVGGGGEGVCQRGIRVQVYNNLIFEEI